MSKSKQILTKIEALKAEMKKAEEAELSAAGAVVKQWIKSGGKDDAVAEMREKIRVIFGVIQGEVPKEKKQVSATIPEDSKPAMVN